ncbi:Enolase-phosphatase E1 [Tyrophagus putrescentiae]|nr:Enolase-phosphatase E1 [Tyrophagus putrescentiae]
MSLVVRKPKAILFDVICTVTKSSWLEKVVYPFLWRNAAAYLSRNWGNRVLARDVELLRLQAAKEGREFTVSRDQQSKATEASIAAVAAYVQHCLETMVNHEAIRNFSTAKLETAVYSDAAICLADWATKESIMLHVVSSGWAEAMRRLLARTNHSDLSLIIRSFVDTELGPMEEAATYRAVLKRLGLGPEETLFLTHSARKAVAAHQAGLNVVMVATHREDEARERSFSPVVQSAGMPFIRIFTDLTFSVDAPLASTLVDREAMNRAINRSVQLQPQVTAVSTSVVSKSKSSPREKSCSSKKTRKMMMEKTSSRSSRKKNILKVVASHSKSRSGPGQELHLAN